MRVGAVISFALSVASIAATAPYEHHAIHEKRSGSSPRWIKRDRVPSNKRLPVRIGLTQSNLDNAAEYLLDLWTSDQVIEAFCPSETAVQAVRDWLADHGIENVTHSDNKGWLAFNARVSKVEALLRTEYFEHEDAVTGGIIPACDKYHVPITIQEHIDYITPGTRLMAPVEGDTDLKLKKRVDRQVNRQKPQWMAEQVYKQLSKNASDLSHCDQAITPACVKALYKIPPGHLADPTNSLGIFEAELQFWHQVDLDLFYANFTPSIPQRTHPINYEIDGAPPVTTRYYPYPDMLDLMLAYPIVYPQTITVWNVDDLHYQTWENDTYTWGFNGLLDAIDGSYCTYSAYGETGDAPGIDPTYPDPSPGGYNGTLQCGIYKPPNVFSFSYGGQEADVPIAYQKRQCHEFLKLGLQGVSFLFASGDLGVSNYPAPYGFDGPTGCLGPDLNIYNPTWPNGCPWVTNVGATKVYPGYTVFDPESAAYDPAVTPRSVNYSSGGGFSNVYGVPHYQKKAADTFLKDHNPPYPYYRGLSQNALNPTLPNVTALAGDTGRIYNRDGRGIPDVAANGDDIAVYIGGKFGLAGGTSASTPIFSAIVNRINEERIAVGKGPVGFINPVLYDNPGVLNDITNGNNPGCGTIGFEAVKGWDPVTGLGTPNYPKMLDLFMSLP
ncbi:putative protease S8 tripeptidyl peptidase I [Pseudomassariella vexata]|uniref:Putative protease S8 tripeptidyl peptidase I n=1 Tax=Pseudomassariella vexata TaxID=1141098 RepID=A0A1Y2DI71_9PEZI|nr:putative protease S8 tripeptidyl peptidase I [Pseudomassariella vexata]ORY58836.1 putative protease S8 tripeptidyl peptidase I [Pseudomassariella vexata]